MRNSATRAGEACTTPLVVASVLLRSLGLEVCESSFGDLHPSARHHIPGRLAFQVSVVPQSKHNFTVQVAIALIPDRIYSKVLRDVVQVRNKSISTRGSSVVNRPQKLLVQLVHAILLVCLAPS